MKLSSDKNLGMIMKNYEGENAYMRFSAFDETLNPDKYIRDKVEKPLVIMQSCCSMARYYKSKNEERPEVI